MAEGNAAPIDLGPSERLPFKTCADFFAVERVQTAEAIASTRSHSWRRTDPRALPDGDGVFTDHGRVGVAGDRRPDGAHRT